MMDGGEFRGAFAGSPDRLGLADAAVDIDRVLVLGRAGDAWREWVGAQGATLTELHVDPDTYGGQDELIGMLGDLERYDVVIALGILPRMRHALLFLDHLRLICDGIVVCDAVTVPDLDSLPLQVVRGIPGTPGNELLATESLVASWMRSAGFSCVWRAREPEAGRTVYVAAAAESWHPVLRGSGLIGEFTPEAIASSRAALDARFTEPGLEDGDRLLFLHLPKVGGTSVVDLLARHFGDDLLHEVTWPGLLDRRDELDDSRAFVGHFFLTVRDFFDVAPRTLAFFRDPVERVVSEYHFIRRVPEHPRHELVMGQSLLEFVTPKRNLMTYCRFLGFGPVDGDLRRMDQLVSDEELVESCKRAVEQMDFVGLTEHFDDHYRRLERWLGATPAQSVPRENAAPTLRPELPPEVVERIHENAWIDMEIYRHAVRVVRERLGPVRYRSRLD